MELTTKMRTMSMRMKINSYFLQRRGVTTLRSTVSLPNHIVPTLRQHPPSSSSPPPTFPFLNPDIVPPRPTLEESSPAGKVFKLTWPMNPRNILVVKKQKNDRVRGAAIRFARHVHETYPVNIIVEPEAAEEVEHDLPFAYTPPKNDIHAELHRTVDAIVTLGGDGTILHATSLFSSTHVPPILSFSLGTLGFLLPFNIKDYKYAFSELYCSNARVLNRMRLTCQSTSASLLSTNDPKSNKILQVEDFTNSQEPIIHAMNEVVLHRAESPHLTMLKIYIDGVYLTEAIADGLILSTPTGSTAYSLSASGPLIHPSHPSILLTPICPRSLSFRPLILPPTSVVDVQISNDARGGAEVSVDGRQGRLLMPGEGIRVGSAPMGWEVPCISRPVRKRRGEGTLASVSEDFVRQAVKKGTGVGIGGKVVGEESEEPGGGWVEDLNGLLGFNRGFRGRYVDRHED